MMMEIGTFDWIFLLYSGKTRQSRTNFKDGEDGPTDAPRVNGTTVGPQ